MSCPVSKARININVQGHGSTNPSGVRIIDGCTCIDLKAVESDSCWEFSHWSGSDIENTSDKDITYCHSPDYVDSGGKFSTQDYGLDLYSLPWASTFGNCIRAKREVQINYVEGGLETHDSYFIIFEVNNDSDKTPISKILSILYSAGVYNSRKSITPVTLQAGKYYFVGIQPAFYGVIGCGRPDGIVEMMMLNGVDENRYNNPDIELLHGGYDPNPWYGDGVYHGLGPFYFSCPDGSGGFLSSGSIRSGVSPLMGFGYRDPSIPNEEDIYFTANFKKKVVDMNVEVIHEPHCAGHSVSGNVTLSHNSGNHNIDCGETVCLKVSTTNRWRFVKWRIYNRSSGALVGESSDSMYCFEMPQYSIDVKVDLKPRVSLKVSAKGNPDVPVDYYGNIDIGFGENWYDCNSYVYFCPTGRGGWYFSHFEGKDGEFYKNAVDGEVCYPHGSGVPHFGIAMSKDREFTCVFVDGATYNRKVDPYKEFIAETY